MLLLPGLSNTTAYRLNLTRITSVTDTAITQKIFLYDKPYILGSVYCTVPVSDIKSLLHRIAFFALIRFKYSTLTHRFRSPDGVVVSTLDCNADGWDIDSRRTRCLKIALESYFASCSFFFSKILLLELRFGQQCQPER